MQASLVEDNSQVLVGKSMMDLSAIDSDSYSSVSIPVIGEVLGGKASLGDAKNIIEDASGKFDFKLNDIGTDKSSLGLTGQFNDINMQKHLLSGLEAIAEAGASYKGQQLTQGGPVNVDLQFAAKP
jgi:hypothetical protein